MPRNRVWTLAPPCQGEGKYETERWRSRWSNSNQPTWMARMTSCRSVLTTNPFSCIRAARLQSKNNSTFLTQFHHPKWKPPGKPPAPPPLRPPPPPIPPPIWPPNIWNKTSGSICDPIPPPIPPNPPPWPNCSEGSIKSSPLS